MEIILIGAGVGLIVDYSAQVWNNTQNKGMNFWDAVYHESISEQSMAASAIGGGVGAGTMGLAAPTTLAGAMGWGGLAGLAGGQASALTQASWDQAAQLLSGQGLDGQQFLLDARAAGVLDPSTMAIDTATGSLVSGAGNLLSRVIPGVGAPRSPGGPPMVMMRPDGSLGIEISGRPGLQLDPTTAQRLMYALSNGFLYDAQAILEEVANLAGSAVWEAWFGVDNDDGP